MRSLLKLSIFLLVLVSFATVATAQFCGDGTCNSGEESWCTADCTIAGFCGDGTCDSGELSWCTADCAAHEPAPFCGDGTCDAGEESWCTADCSVSGFCGDGTCDAGEASWCSADCPVSPPENNPPVITTFNLPDNVPAKSLMSIPVAATDDIGLAELRLVNVTDPSKPIVKGTHNCGGSTSCSTTFSSHAPFGDGESYVYELSATDTAGMVSQRVKSSSTARKCIIHTTGEGLSYNPGEKNKGVALPPPVAHLCPSRNGIAECLPDGSWDLLDCFDDDGESVSAPSCTPSWQCVWSDAANSCGTRTCTDVNNCGTTAGKPADESKSCPAPACIADDYNCVITPAQCPVSGVQTVSCTLKAGSVCDEGHPSSVNPSGTQSCTPPNSPPSITQFSLPSSASPGAVMSIPVTAIDADAFKVASIKISGTGISPTSQDCGNSATCSVIFQVTAPSGFDEAYSYTVTATDSAGLSSTSKKSGSTTSAPVCVENWQCTGWSDAVNSCGTRSCTDLNACGTTASKPSETLACPITPPVCTENWQCTGWSDAANSCGTRTCTDLNACGTTTSMPPESATCPLPVDDAPIITSFNVPSTVDANAHYTVSVTAMDDLGVKRIKLTDASGASLASAFDCSNLVSCTASFIIQSPAQFDFVYSIVATVFDTIDQTDTATSSDIRTNPEPVSPPVLPVEPDKVLDDVEINLRNREIFVSTVVPDSACISPGASSFLFTSLQNRGDGKINDVKITATVPELGIRAVSGPFDIRRKGLASRFIPFDVPAGVPEGEYYVRTTISTDKDSVVKYRLIEVKAGC